MLNIGKLRRGGENYYLNSVARGVEDYYLGSGEAPGYWLASGADHLGLSGEVGDTQLRNILRGRAPGSGSSLVKARSKERVPGFDLTFLAPKSVALLHELGSKDASNEVVNAHNAAVAAALSYMERNASGARRGKGGRRSIASQGFIAAAFRHRTSRAGDPLLHTHVLVANIIKGADGKWGALDAKHLYRQAKTAGYLYQSHLRHELTRRLRVEWQPIRKGAADIEGIPHEAIKGFSQRRNEVRAVLGERNATGRQREVAALQTRQAKDYRVSPQRLLPEWRDKAAELGLDDAVLERAIGRDIGARGPKERLSEVGARLAAPYGLTAQASIFSRREVLQGLCGEFPEGASVADVESMADSFLAFDLVVPLSERSIGSTGAASANVLGQHAAVFLNEARYSTTEMMALEQRVIAHALVRRLEAAAIARQTDIDNAVRARPSLFPDQRAMVQSLTSSGMGVEVVVGKAGAGKTFALDAARHAWEASGYQLLGCSLSARAAQELEAGSGIPSCTIARLLQDLAGSGRALITERHVLVVDEAGMVGTRDLDRLLSHAAHAGSKVVLVGDDKQLPEIEAGGAFRGIKNRLPSIELSEVRRQPFGWERDTLDLVREGQAKAAIDAYLEHDRVVIESSPEATRARLIENWWATQDDPEPAVMIAARRSDVADLNARARAVMRASGRLGETEVVLDGVAFACGDRIMTLKNAPRLGVKNGTRGMLESLDVATGTVTMRCDDGSRLIKLPRSYLQAGHLTHGYAMTGHKTQAMTTNKAFVLGDETLYREWTYVAMSRGRNDNRLYVVSGLDQEREEVGGEVAAIEDPLEELTQAVARSRAKELAIDAYEENGVRELTLDELRDRWALLGKELATEAARPETSMARWKLENAPRIRRLEALERELWWREQHRSLAVGVGMPQYLLNARAERSFELSTEGAGSSEARDGISVQHEPLRDTEIERSLEI